MSYEVAHVAQIPEEPNTIGIADSELYLQGTLEQINARLDLMESLGVTNVRIMVPWAGVQPLHPDTPFGLGAPRWGQLDAVVNAAAERGMGILGVLNSTPIWATNGTPINGMPADINRFANFAKAVALRYGDKISAYEVWNEPNAAQYLSPLSPEAYTEMLKVTYTALKEAQAQIGSEITVVGGVIGAGLTWGDYTMNPVDFVRRMYAAGAHGYFDAMSFHPYNYEWKFSQGDSLPWREGMPLYQLNRIREMMDAHLEDGQEQLKIWISEYGVPTNRVSEETQAAFIRDLIEYWQTAEGAGPIFIYTSQDRVDLTGNDDEAHLGIFRPDGSLKPAAEVVKELIEYFSDPTNPGPGPGPGTPAFPSNPIAALLQSLQQAVSSLLNFVPTLFNAVGVLISNLIGGIFGGSSQPASARTVRTAGADLAVRALDADGAEDGRAAGNDDGTAATADADAQGGVRSVTTVRKAGQDAAGEESADEDGTQDAVEDSDEKGADQVSEEDSAHQADGEGAEAEDGAAGDTAEAPESTDESSEESTDTQSESATESTDDSTSKEDASTDDTSTEDAASKDSDEDDRSSDDADGEKTVKSDTAADESAEADESGTGNSGSSGVRSPNEQKRDAPRSVRNGAGADSKADRRAGLRGEKPTAAAGSASSGVRGEERRTERKQAVGHSGAR
ncbi:cellulase family glycosylhydrolase [Mycobacterium sp. C31M]